MRILMLSDDFLPNPGGIAAHVYELTRQLAWMGHEVDLLAGHNRIHDGGPVPELPAGARLIRNRSFTWSQLGYTGTAFNSTLHAWRLRSQKRYDVCHWHNLIWETSAARLGGLGIPRVFTNHSSGFLRRMKVQWRRRHQLPVILNSADSVIAPSRELAEKTSEAGFPAARTHYIANGVDVADFSPRARDRALQQKHRLTDEDRVIAIPRRFDPKNGVDVAVAAMPEILRRIPRAKLLLVGDGDERGRLERLTRELGVGEQVIFAGSQPRHLMPAYLQLADVAALPSRAEAVSLAGLEAMAMELPLVGSNVGGIPEFVHEGDNGRLVRVDDPAALAGAVADLFVMPDEARLAMGRRARASVTENFSWRTAAEKTLRVYEATSRPDTSTR